MIGIYTSVGNAENGITYRLGTVHLGNAGITGINMEWIMCGRETPVRLLATRRVRKFVSGQTIACAWRSDGASRFDDTRSIRLVLSSHLRLFVDGGVTLVSFSYQFDGIN